ncbi:ABC transporter substrate-binding protein [Thioalkalivibrio halophilus]|uniref:SsuA/THI5-like domain-containing protein n=1 Tax=Thioalkalivibrio halophilus TaxID=252474 RepID=A0A1V3A2F7_9GAMM|nr:hypothetical protein B1A74_01175 [Thioalkalivibrio halophilus]
MYMDRRHFLVAAGATLPALLGACGRPEPPLEIAGHVWPGYEPMFLARAMGWLDPERVRLRETASASESMRRLATGEVHGAALTLDEVLRVRARGTDLRIVLVFNISAGADMVLARPGIEALEDLAGRRVGVEDSALGALMLHHTLDTAGLGRDQVKTVSLTIDEQEAAWERDEVDAVVTYQPVADRLRDDGAHVLFDSRAMPDTIFDVLAIEAGHLERLERSTRHLIAAHFRALHHLRANPVDAGYRMAERLGVPGHRAMETFRGLVLPDPASNRRLLDGSDSRVLLAAREIAGLSEDAGAPLDRDFGDELVRHDLLPREDPR